MNLNGSMSTLIEKREERIEQIISDTKALKKEGLRYTHQRQSIWDEICATDDHRDAEEIYLSLCNKGKNVSRATLYRTIDVLVKNRLVRKLELGDV